MNLSVIIPTFNRKDSLRRTLEGLERQKFPLGDFEVIVVSDGSTDGTEEWLSDYAAQSAMAVRPIFQENSGPSAARNRGIAEAKGKIIVFLDDDVEPVPEFLERHAAHHLIDEKAVVLGPMSPDIKNCQNELLWIAWEHAKLQQTYDLFRSGGEWHGHPAGAMHFYSGNASVRRCWLQMIGGFNEHFKRQEDVEMAARLAEECAVHFVFDFDADGIHRPVRSWESWLRIPAAYGSLDAERVRQGQLREGDVRKEASRRNRITRMLTRLCAGQAGRTAFAARVIKKAAVLLDQIGRRPAALALLSALYNTCYAVAYAHYSCQLTENSATESLARPTTYAA